MSQGTPEWFLDRAGHCTASRAADVLAKIKTGEAATRRKYRIQLITERLTGRPMQQGFVSTAMQWGTQTEPEARMAYEADRGECVQEVGFKKHPAIEWVGASPDGEIASDGLIEIKCPESTTHLDWLDGNRVPPEHVPQIQFQLWVTGRQWCDFVSYDPRFPAHLQLLIVRAQRDDVYIQTLEAEVVRFLTEIETSYNTLMRKAA